MANGQEPIDANAVLRPFIQAVADMAEKRLDEEQARAMAWANSDEAAGIRDGIG